MTEIAIQKAGRLPSQLVPFLRAVVPAYSKLLVVGTLLLIFAGAQVKTHEAGLAVPDWPTSFGYNMFTYPIEHWVGGIFYEHTHRLIASVIGAMTVILALALQMVDSRRWVRRLGWIAVTAVIVQGVLGGLTVIHKLPVYLSASHGVLAQTFFLITILLAYSQSFEFHKRTTTTAWPSSYRYFKVVVAVMVLVYLQLIFGAVMRHLEAGLAVPDFPLMGGQIIPGLGAAGVESSINAYRAEIGYAPADGVQIWSHLVHRIWGIALFVVTSIAAVYGRLIFPACRRLCNALFGVVAIQFLLGVATVLSGRAPFFTSFHVLFGALLLGILMLLALRAYPFRARSSEY